MWPIAEATYLQTSKILINTNYLRIAKKCVNSAEKAKIYENIHRLIPPLYISKVFKLLLKVQSEFR